MTKLSDRFTVAASDLTIQRATHNEFDPDQPRDSKQATRNELNPDKAALLTDTEPTEAQRAAGNYAKGKFNWNGLQISIENPRGSTRQGTSFVLIQGQQFPSQSFNDDLSRHISSSFDADNSPSHFSKGFVFSLISFDVVGDAVATPIKFDSNFLGEICQVNIEPTNGKIGNSFESIPGQQFVKAFFNGIKVNSFLPSFSDILIPTIRAHGKGTQLVAFSIEPSLDSNSFNPQSLSNFSTTETLLVHGIHLFGTNGDFSHVSIMHKLLEENNGISIQLDCDVIIAKPWSRTLFSHYGYIKGTISESDGDHIDCFMGPNPDSKQVFVVDQIKPSGIFDEHKCMLGFDDIQSAKAGYLANYPKDWQIGPVSEIKVPEFKWWLEHGDSSQPYAM